MKPILQIKKLCRIIDATIEPYREWHTPDVKPLLNPATEIVIEVPTLSPTEGQ